MSRYRLARHFGMAVGMLAMTMAISPAQTTSTDNGPEQDVIRQENQYADAVKRQDMSALQSILAEDFIATSSRGELRNKAMELDDLKPNSDYSIDSFQVDGLRVRVFDNTAIVTGRQILVVLYNHQPFTSLFRYTRVYLKRANRWQVVAQQLTALPQQGSR